MSTPSDVAQDRAQSLKGTFSDDFAAVTDELQAQLDSGNERGASLVINVDGENVVDVWGGFADTECTRPLESDTIANVWSTTKTVTYLSMLMLADRGLIDFDTPVATYWPEFAQNGKEAITVGQVMSHTSGVSGWDQPVTVERQVQRHRRQRDAPQRRRTAKEGMLVLAHAETMTLSRVNTIPAGHSPLLDVRMSLSSTAPRGPAHLASDQRLSSRGILNRSR